MRENTKGISCMGKVVQNYYSTVFDTAGRQLEVEGKFEGMAGLPVRVVVRSYVAGYYKGLRCTGCWMV